MDRYLLQAEMQRRGFNATQLAKAIGISKSAFSKKINGKSEFTLSEIQGIVEVLGLESPVPIFFAKRVS